MARKRKALDLTSAPELSDKTLLYLIGFAIIIAGLANSYLLMQMAKNFQQAGDAILDIKVAIPEEIPSDGGQQEEPQDALALLKPETKALIDQYQVGGTPTLILNCNKKRVGTYAVAEQGQNLPAGSELNSLLSTLCSITGPEGVFCSGVNSTVIEGLDAKLNESRKDLPPGTEPGIVIQTTADSPCGSAERVLIYAFYSPTCQFCEAQRSIIAALQEKYPDAIAVTTVCTPIHGTGDVDLCKSQTDKYDRI